MWPALLLSSLALFLVLVDTPVFRNGIVQGDQACAVGQLVKLPPSVDLIVIGSSRIRESVDPILLSQVSEGGIRQPMNFARSGIDAERNYSILSDLLARGARPAVVILEVDLDKLSMDEEPKSIPMQTNLGIISYASILQSYYVYPQRPVIERLNRVAQKLLLKLQAGLVYAISGGAVKHHMQALRSDRAEASCDRNLYLVRNPLHIRRYQESIQEFDRLFGMSRLSAEDDRFRLRNTLHAQNEMFYLDRIRSIAVQHQVRLLVTRMWKAGQPPLSQAALSRIRADIPEFIYPPGELVRESWKNFVDASHLNSIARETYSRWLASEVLRSVRL